MIEVAQLAHGEDGAWDDFLRTQCGGLFYHSSWYRDLIAEEVGGVPEYLVAREGGDIRGALPLIWSRDADLGGRVMNSLPFNGSHGSPIAATPEAERTLIGAWDERSHDPGTLAATMVGNPFTERVTAPPVHELSGERGNYSLVLPERGTREEVLAVVGPEARSNVRKAERRGVTVELRSDADAVEHVRQIHRERMSELGIEPKSDSFVAAIPDRLRASEDFDAWVARREERVVGAMLTLRFNRVADYFLSGSYPGEKTHNPHAALIFTALAHEARRGTRIWNWGGETSRGSVNRFKRKWGATPRRYGWFTHVNDRSVLGAGPEVLADAFPRFFVVPYSALTGRATTRSRS